MSRLFPTFMDKLAQSNLQTLPTFPHHLCSFNSYYDLASVATRTPCLSFLISRMGIQDSEGFSES